MTVCKSNAGVRRGWASPWMLAGIIGACLAAGVLMGGAQPAERTRPRQDGPGLLGRMTAFQTEVPAHAHDIVLVRPTATSVSASVVSYADAEAYLELVGPSRPSRGPARTAALAMKAGEPALFTFSDLRPDTAYTYRLWSRAAAGAKGREAEFQPSAEYGFHTQRPPGAAGGFTFTVVADSHLDAPMTPAVYEQTMLNALADKPDFHVDLGDTFMTDKRGREFKSAAAQYVAQRYYFGKLCHSAPLFMALGNHDGEWGYAKGDQDAMAPWSYAQRTRLFPPPEISGDAAAEKMYAGRTGYAKGQGANYYTFAWGDARIIVLDPFWFTDVKARGPGGRGTPDADTALSDQGWNLTLGREQYDWLTRTLETSRSRFTFVFIHHLVGGFGRASRGGAEAAGYFEWGGRNADGSEGWAAHRPDWAMPIHQLFVKHRVSAVFHGHDHLYVHEELDGIAYQSVPQPGNVNGGTRSAGEYGYRKGKVLGSPGHVRVKVSANEARVEFVRSSIAKDQAVNGSVVDSYSMVRD